MLALLYPMISDPWGVVWCAFWPRRPGAEFRSWSFVGVLSGVPRRGGALVGVWVALGFSTGVYVSCLSAVRCACGV